MNCIPPYYQRTLQVNPQKVSWFNSTSCITFLWQQFQAFCLNSLQSISIWDEDRYNSLKCTSMALCWPFIESSLPRTLGAVTHSCEPWLRMQRVVACCQLHGVRCLHHQHHHSDHCHSKKIMQNCRVSSSVTVIIRGGVVFDTHIQAVITLISIIKAYSILSASTSYPVIIKEARLKVDQMTALIVRFLLGWWVSIPWLL